MLPILFPVIAVVLPLLLIARAEKRPPRRPWLYSLGSFASAMAALCQEVWVFHRRAEAGDVSGIMDTAGAVLAICVALALITCLLNLIALVLSYETDENQRED